VLFRRNKVGLGLQWRPLASLGRIFLADKSNVIDFTHQIREKKKHQIDPVWVLFRPVNQDSQFCGNKPYLAIM
jgi:hypothetical protein